LLLLLLLRLLLFIVFVVAAVVSVVVVAAAIFVAVQLFCVVAVFLVAAAVVSCCYCSKCDCVCLDTNRVPKASLDKQCLGIIQAIDFARDRGNSVLAILITTWQQPSLQ